MTQIIPIRDLKNTSEISEMTHSTDKPVYITKNGYGDMVIMSIETYDQSLRRLEMYDSLSLSLEQANNGQLSDAKDFMNRLKKKYDL